MSEYRFRREDTGEVVSVDFETMMGMDVSGYITLPDGVVARRVREAVPVEKAAPRVSTDITSDAMGFTKSQLADHQADKERNGFTGVEFVPDPRVDGFYQVKCNSPRQWQRYVKHRGFVDRNGSTRSKVLMSPRQFEQAKEMVLRCQA